MCLQSRVIAGRVRVCVFHLYADVWYADVCRIRFVLTSDVYF